MEIRVLLLFDIPSGAPAEGALFSFLFFFFSFFFQILQDKR